MTMTHAHDLGPAAWAGRTGEGADVVATVFSEAAERGEAVFNTGLRVWEDEAERYLEFERWWSGFYFMNENEIRWIVDNLFIGNKLARGGVSLDAGQHVDLRNIRAPIIIFASHGDNITPPPQALNWIADIYKDVRQIKARGQKIIYTIHDTIGHLGIFVSSSVAKKQHSQITSALKTIEDLSPGLYEMKIVEVKGEGVDRTYEVDFEERSIEDVLKLDGDRDDELPLSAIARFSQFGADLYQMTLRPFIKSVVSKASAQQLVDSNPLRMRRYAMSDRNPLLTAMVPLAEAVALAGALAVASALLGVPTGCVVTVVLLASHLGAASLLAPWASGAAIGS